MKVLLVDDSATIRKIQKKILKELDFSDITEAEDGLVALEHVKQAVPDLILLDWNMPNMDGLAFVKEFRSLGHTSPVIMVTTEGEKERIIEAIKAGVNNYLIKPFAPEALGERISQTLAQHKAA